MALSNGTRLGPYEILALIGAGGMGEVYRARDTRLDRSVAIKILPPTFSESAQLRARFEREAKTISSLANPHICTIHDVGHDSGVDYLVMEYLEGESLADRLTKGPLPLDQLLRTGIEIATALDAAHRQGITHRDLKPGNIMMTKSGAKLLDFGLAKHEQEALDVAASEATQHKPLTDAGTIVGTFQYMAPEQVEGRPADARTDIFALGCVLYEAATGQRAFDGKSRASLIASILDHEPPPISAVRAMSPPSLDRVVRACLRKEPDERIQTAHDLMLDLTWIRDGSMTSEASLLLGPKRKKKVVMAAALALSLIAAAAFAALWLSSREPSGEPMTLSIVPDAAAQLPIGRPYTALSPDGTLLVFVADAKSDNSLWLRSLDNATPRRLQGTESASKPFWSPDGKWVAFFSRGKLKKVEVATGAVQPICDTAYGVGGAWNAEGVILFAARYNEGLFRVSASGGEPVPVTKLDRSKKESLHGWPVFLPDGRRFLCVYRTVGDERNEVRAGSLDGGPLSLLVKADALVGYSPPWLLYEKENILYAQKFDEKRLKLTGEAQQIVSDLGYEEDSGTTGASVTPSAIAYSPAYLARTEFQLFDRAGTQVGVMHADDGIGGPAVSPDGKRLLFEKYDTKKGAPDIWVADLARGTTTKLTSGLATTHLPVWSPDGKRMAFTSDRNGMYDIYVQDAGEDTAPSAIWKSGNDKNVASWSSDGRIFAAVDTPGSGDDVWSVPAGGGEPRQILASPHADTDPQVSPDGRLLAFWSDRSGKPEVYVRPLAGGASTQISNQGGTQARWSADSSEVFYASEGRVMTAVRIGERDGEIDAGAPQALFPFPPGYRGHDWVVLRDGRFVIPMIMDRQGRYINVLLNWRAKLEK